MYVNVSVCMALATAYCAAFIGALTSLTATDFIVWYPNPLRQAFMLFMYSLRSRLTNIQPNCLHIYLYYVIFLFFVFDLVFVAVFVCMYVCVFVYKCCWNSRVVLLVDYMLIVVVSIFWYWLTLIDTMMEAQIDYP